MAGTTDLESIYAGAVPNYATWRRLLVHTTLESATLGQTGWLEQIIHGSETGVLMSLSGSGDNGGVFATQSVTSNTSAPKQAVAAYALNNNTLSPRPLHAVFAEARRMGLSGVTTGLDVVITNQGDVQDIHPYTLLPWGTSAGLIVSAGRNGVPSADASVGIALRPGLAAFRRGIDIGATAISSYPGVGAPAINMAAGHAVTWWAPDVGAGGVIRSGVIDTTGFVIPPTIVFAGTGLDIYTADNVNAVSIRNGFVAFASTTIGGSFTSVGPGFFESTLQVAGDTTLSGALGVGGAVTFSGPLSVVSLTTPLMVSNNGASVTFAGTGLDIKTTDNKVAVTLRNDVVGLASTAIGGTLLTVGAVTLESTLSVAGNASFASTLTIGGNASLLGTLVVAQPITAPGLWTDAIHNPAGGGFNFITSGVDLRSPNGGIAAFIRDGAVGLTNASVLGNFLVTGLTVLQGPVQLSTITDAGNDAQAASLGVPLQAIYYNTTSGSLDIRRT